MIELLRKVALQFLALQSIYLIYFVQIFLTKDKLDAGVQNEFSMRRVEAPERPEPLLDSLVHLVIQLFLRDRTASTSLNLTSYHLA